MTAYGRAALAVPLGHFAVELSSVNRRHLEINCHCPPELLSFDVDFKKWIAAAVSRGAINVKLSLQLTKSSVVTLKPNLVLARQLKDAWDAISLDLELPKENGFKLEMIADVEQIILQESDVGIREELRNVLHQLFHQALEQLVIMKDVEGMALWDDISERLEIIHDVIKEIELIAPETVKRLHNKLRERLEEVVPGVMENEERILREICIYAEKADISEELARLKSHLDQFRNLIDDTEVRVGKTLDFLVQEMNREMNTIGSKSSELKISQHVIAAKTELERIREQIQNVE
jgi:uncharacterized protein (TIGR00255 family)